jgi:maltose O-acetyltransferase
MIRIKGSEFKLTQLICLGLYYLIATHLPDSYSLFGGKTSNAFRVFLCKHIFKHCGKIRTINRKVNFGSGKDIEMGDDSGIGANTEIPSDTIIGKSVMLSRRCFVLHRNHEFSRTDIPIIEQGFKEKKRLIIEDDCWIGLNCILTPGRHIKKGSIVAMGSVLTKDFPAYSIIGGNPAKFIKSRIQANEQ